MITLPLLVTVQNRWIWPLVIILGLVVSSMLSRFSVGKRYDISLLLLLKYSLHFYSIKTKASNKSYTQYNGYSGPKDGVGNRFKINQTMGRNIMNVCKLACDSDRTCVYIDYDKANSLCLLFPESQLSSIVPRPNHIVYLKSGYKFSTALP